MLCKLRKNLKGGIADTLSNHQFVSINRYRNFDFKCIIVYLIFFCIQARKLVFNQNYSHMLLRLSSLFSISAILFFPLIGEQVSKNNVNTTRHSNITIYSYSDTTYKIIPSIDNTYGYEILINGKALIRQKSIPGLPGSNGFKRKEDAEKTARLVLKKLSAGLMPPSIDKHELDSMKVKY